MAIDIEMDGLACAFLEPFCAGRAGPGRPARLGSSSRRGPGVPEAAAPPTSSSTAESSRSHARVLALKIAKRPRHS